MHIHLKVIGTHLFLDNFGDLNPKTNLGKELMGAIHNSLSIFLNILHTKLHVILTIHLHHNHKPIHIHLKYTLPLNYLYHNFKTHTLKVSQPTYNADVKHFQTSPLEINGIQHSSGRVLQKRDYLDIIEGQNAEEEDSKEKIK